MRAGGSALTIDDATERLTRAGFTGVEDVTREMNVPLQLVVARVDA